MIDNKLQALYYKNSILHFGKNNLAEFTKDYQGPRYIYNLDILEDRFLRMQKALPSTRLFYAVKANPNVEILKKLQQLGAGADVVSLGEVQRAIQCGFKASDIIYSGVGKTHKELMEAIQLGIHQINVESIPELIRIGELAQQFNKKVQVAVRLNPDVDIKTHPYIATGLRDNKFGIELSLLPDVVQIIKKSQYLQLVGLSLHLGSQMQETGSFRDALKILMPIFNDLRKDFSSVTRFDFGGGLGIYYENFDWKKEIENLESYAAIVKEEFKGFDGELQSEPGRWLVARAGVLLCQVQYVKKTSQKTFVIVDTGMNHLIRPSLYEAYHHLWAVRESNEQEVYDVVGPICESSDFFAKDRQMTKVKEGDFMVIGDAGAYGFSMASTYNLQPLPEEMVIF